MENNSINTLHNLLDYNVSKFISAEVELKNSLPIWIREANSLQLKNILEKYLEFVSQHLKRIDEFIQEEQIGMLSVSNPIMLAFIKETDECLASCTNAAVKDACLLAYIQEINHYKICFYGTGAAFSTLLELEKSATMFREAEVNEKHIDDHVSQLAMYEINKKAKSPISLPK